MKTSSSRLSRLVVASSTSFCLETALTNDGFPLSLTFLPSFLSFSSDSEGKLRLGERERERERERGGATMRFITGEQMAAARQQGWPNECVERQSRGIFMNPTKDL